MAASASSLLAAAASSSCAAISPRLPRGAPAAASVPSPSRHYCTSLRASPARRHQSRFVASVAPTMQPPAESRVSTVVDVDLGDRSYPIYIGAGLLDEPDLLQRHVHGKRVLVVTNTTVAPLYLEKVTWALTHNNPNVSVESVILPDGEKYKDMDTLMKVFDKAIESRLDRKCTFVALGGGVIGDMCGFAAAAFLRGVNFIQIPTTLMSQVDSSVGGKTGINHPLGKNLIGAFYQPQCVLIDTETLNPDLAGGECVPMADGGEMDEEAMRAFFPLSFGKAPARPSSAASSAHSSTLRKPPNPSNPKPSVSTAADEDGGAMIGPPRPPPASAGDDDDEDGGGMIGPPRPPLPSAHGDGEDDEGGGMIGPPRPPPPEDDDDDEEEDDDDMEDDGDGGFNRIPLSNEIVLRGHTKVVSALAIDHTGSRVLSGSYDYTVRMYDFQGMNSKLQSFRQLEPFEGHQVRSLSWSPTSDRFLCVTGSAQAKIYDRDGLTLGEFVKGDMYIRDLKNTKGHISGLTGGEWNPKSKETILTSSEDGSIRLWDVSDFKSQKQVIKPKLIRPMRIPVTSCAWDHEGKRIVAGIGDGSIQLWTIKAGWGSRPDIHVEKTHKEDITGVKFSTDGQILLSRSMDSTLKIWDLRKMKTPLKVFEDLPNHYAETNAAFSPDEQLIFTGTSIEKDGDNGGRLCFFDRKKLELVSRVGISPHYSVIRCLWHPRINQVFATVGDKKEGGTHILYDPSISQRGALVCVGRAPRKKSVDDFEVQPVIHNPHALPLFRDQPSRKRQREKILKDPLKSHKPEAPVNGPGYGGRVGTTKGSLLTQYLLKEGGLIKDTWMDEDPREAILKYADAAEKDPKFIAPAYSQTQPKPVFAESDSDNEEK